MSDEVSTGIIVAIAAGVTAVVEVIKAGFNMLAKLFRKKNADDKQARDDAKADTEKRDLWDKVNKIDDDLSQHRVDDAAAFATLNTTQSSILKAVERIETKVDTIYRKSTGKTGGR